MIKIDKEELIANVSEIKELTEDFNYLLNDLQKISSEIQDTAHGQRVFPNMIEEIKAMLEDLDKFGVENINEISGFIEEMIDSFEEVDQEISKRMEK